MSPRKPKVVPDAARPGMWRVRWPDGRVSDMTTMMCRRPAAVTANLTWGGDAIACFMETEERRRRGRQSHSEGRPVRQN